MKRSFDVAVLVGVLLAFLVLNALLLSRAAQPVLNHANDARVRFAHDRHGHAN